MLKAISASRGPSLSKNWEVSKAHKGAYSGGKVDLSGDGSFLACLYEADVSFVDVEEGVATRRLRNDESEGAEEEIVSFALHPNDREIVTASQNLLLRHWDIASGECKRVIKTRGHRVLCMDYDGTGTLVATGSSDHTIKVWDVERGYCTHNFRGHTGVVSVVAFHPDPTRLVLVSGSEDMSVRVWDLNAQTCTGTLKAHLSYVTSVAFLSEGSGLVTGGRDRVLNVWDMDSHELLKTFPVYEEVEGIQVLPNTEEFSRKIPGSDSGGGSSGSGNLVAVAGKNGVVRVFTLEGQAITESSDNSTAKKKSSSKYKNKSTAALSPPAKRLIFPLKKVSFRCVMTQDNAGASHNAGYTNLLLDRKRGGLVGVTADHNMLMLEPAPIPPHIEVGGGSGGCKGRRARGVVGLIETKRQIIGYNDEVIDMKSVPDGVLGDGEKGGSWVAVATNSPQVRLFELGEFSCRLLDGHTETVLALDVAPDGRHLCTSSKDRTCLLWDLELGVPVVRWSGHADAVGAVAASRKPGAWLPTAAPGGAFVISGAADRTLQRWDVPSKAVAVLEAEARDSRSTVEAAGVARMLEAGGTGEGEGEEDAGARRKKDVENSVTTTASAKHKTGRWKTPTPLLETARRSVRAHDKDINCVAVSPNDMLVASASQDRTVKLWRAKDLEPAGVLKGHKRGVWKVEFSPVDRCVATCSGDRTVKLWSITDCSCLRTFQGHTASVLSVTFISAGAQVMSGGADGLVKVWTVRSDECEATLDAHTDKIWALTTARTPPPKRVGKVGGQEEGREGEGEGLEDGAGPNAGVVVVSGGADSVINVWKDVTAREEEKVIAEKETALLKEQELYNRLRAKDYGPAIGLALELKRPQRLWSVLRDAMTEGMGESTTPAAADTEATTEMSSRRLDQYVASWSMDTIALCLGYCKDWNTNARKSVVVHALVGSILRCVSISSLKDIPGCSELVRILLPYSERHFQRLDRLLQSSYLVEHTLASMNMLIGTEEHEKGSFEAKGAAVRSNGAETKSTLLIARELKRLRDGRSLSAPAKKDYSEDVGSIDSGSEKDADEGLRSSRVEAESEMIGDRVVFNVKADASAASKGMGSDVERDSSDSESENGVGRDVEDDDVDMGDVTSSGIMDRGVRRGTGAGEEEGGQGSGEGSVEKPKKKKKRKKRAATGDEALPTPTSGLVEKQKLVKEAPGKEGTDRETEGNEGEGGGLIEKPRKKTKKRGAAAAGDETPPPARLDPAKPKQQEGETHRKVEAAVDAGRQGGKGDGLIEEKKNEKRRKRGRGMAAAAATEDGIPSVPTVSPVEQKTVEVSTPTGEAAGEKEGRHRENGSISTGETKSEKRRRRGRGKIAAPVAESEISPTSTAPPAEENTVEEPETMRKGEAAVEKVRGQKGIGDGSTRQTKIEERKKRGWGKAAAPVAEGEISPTPTSSPVTGKTVDEAESMRKSEASGEKEVRQKGIGDESTGGTKSGKRRKRRRGKLVAAAEDEVPPMHTGSPVKTRKVEVETPEGGAAGEKRGKKGNVMLTPTAGPVGERKLEGEKTKEEGVTGEKERPKGDEMPSGGDGAPAAAACKKRKKRRKSASACEASSLVAGGDTSSRGELTAGLGADMAKGRGLEKAEVEVERGIVEQKGDKEGGVVEGRKKTRNRRKSAVV